MTTWANKKKNVYENILSVCMYCKDIRYDSNTEPGKGKWLRMEEYLHCTSGTDVSQGCCPEYYEKHKND